MIQRYVMPFFRWWIGQLAGLVPSRLLHAVVEACEAAILEIAGDAFALYVRRKGIVTCAGKGALKDLKTVMDSTANLPQLRLLRIPAGHVLCKRVSLPLAARRDLKTVLGFEIGRETPFEQEEVYWNHNLVSQDTARGKLEADLLVVPRRVGGALADVARDAGFVPGALEIVNDNQSSSYLWLERPNPLRYWRLPPKTRPVMIAAYGLAAAVLLLPFAIQQLQFFLTDKTIARLEGEARTASALNQAANRRVAALAFMGQAHGHGSALEILLATSRALPDDTYLTAFSVQGEQVTMAGSSEAAAKLIHALSSSPTFRDPVFDSALLEDDAGEKFTISAKLATAGAP